MTPAPDTGSAVKTFHDAVRLIGTRRFGVFWVTTLMSNIGFWAQQVAQPWLLLGIGASPFLVGLDACAMDAPVLLLTLPGGILADEADRRRVIALFQSIQMLSATSLVALLWFGTIRIWMVIAISLVIGITDALSMPSFQSIVPSIVASEEVSTGLALNSTQFNLSRILGPAFAGVLMTSIGLIGCYTVNAASYLPFIFVALWVLPRHDRAVFTRSAFDVPHLFKGLRHIVQDQEIREALRTVLITSVLCGPVATFCPVLVKMALHGNAVLFSTSIGAFGVGGLCGATGSLLVGRSSNRRRIAMVFTAIFGAIVTACALNPWPWTLPVLMMLAGLCMSISNTSANTCLLTTVQNDMRGQAVSLFMMAVRGGASLGSLATGMSVDLFGVRAALFINGVLAIALVLILGRKLPKIAAPALSVDHLRAADDAAGPGKAAFP